MFALDTNVMVDIRRGLPAAVDWFRQLEDFPAVPGFVVMELIQGLLNKRQLVELRGELSELEILWPTEVDCTLALANFATLRLSHGLGLLDALIAATVVGRAGTLCTFNVGHYRMVPGLATSQPYARV